MFHNWGLKKKFIIFSCTIAIPTLLFSVLIYYQTNEALKSRAIEEASDKLEKNEQSLLSILSTVETMSSYMIYEDKFRTFFTTPEKESYSPAYNEALEGIKGYFTFQRISNEYISSILMIGRDGQILKHGEPVNGDEEALTLKANEAKGAPVWSNAYQIESDWDGNKHVISLSRVINDVNKINKPIGIVRIRLDQMQLYNSIEAASHQGNYLVISDQGEVVLHNNSALVGEKFPDSKMVNWALNGTQSSYNFKSDNTNYLVVKNKLIGTNWVSVSIIDQDELLSELYSIHALVGYMIVILIVSSIIYFIVFYRSNIKRIIELTNQTKQLENGDFTARVIVNSNDEIGKLGMRFNKMVKTIRRYIETEYKLKIKQKESELKILQGQINPHFLYNTLDMIRWTARLENALETGQQIERLSKIFRMNLNNGKSWITIKEEVEYIQAYLELQKSRLGEKLTYHIFIDDQIKDSFILKQVLQPLVENSIQHGFKNLPRQGVITIRSYKIGDQVWVDVIDNGWGLSDSSVTSQTGYALSNLKERLSILFGEQYGYKFIDTNEGASIRLILPYLNEEKLKIINTELGD